MWSSTENYIGAWSLVNARPRDPLALPTVPQNRVYSKAPLRLLARVFHCDFGVVAEVAVKHSCQQSERGFTIHTVLWHRGQCQWITRSCVDERPSADIVFGTRPHSQDNGNVRYSILGNPSSLLQRRNRHCRNVSGEVGVRLNS